MRAFDVRIPFVVGSRVRFWTLPARVGQPAVPVAFHLQPLASEAEGCGCELTGPRPAEIEQGQVPASAWARPDFRPRPGRPPARPRGGPSPPGARSVPSAHRIARNFSVPRRDPRMNHKFVAPPLVDFSGLASACMILCEWFGVPGSSVNERNSPRSFPQMIITIPRLDGPGRSD
jgi:hypothetical protein